MTTLKLVRNVMKTFVISLSVLVCSITSTAKTKVTLSATQYHPPYHGAQTASGSKIDVRKVKNGKTRWVAMSRDMLKVYPFGTKIYVNSEKHPELNGVWIVKDKMAARHKKCIDFLLAKGDSNLGRTNVEVSHVL